MYHACVILSLTGLRRTRFDHHHTLNSCLPFCLSVPRWNHQKHPRGSGDDNHWSLILSVHCHRLGYEGSGDPHRISERGNHIMLQLSESLTLINQSHAVRCKKYCLKYLKWYVSLFLWYCGFYLTTLLIFWNTRTLECSCLSSASLNKLVQALRNFFSPRLT